jgi:hypothetical protein
MPSLQHSELLPEREVFQKSDSNGFETDECPKSEKKHVEHGPELYQIVVRDPALNC